jgi:hypothetical protein
MSEKSNVSTAFELMCVTRPQNLEGFSVVVYLEQPCTAGIRIEQSNREMQFEFDFHLCLFLSINSCLGIYILGWTSK